MRNSRAGGNQALKRKIGSEGTNLGVYQHFDVAELLGESVEQEKRRQVTTAYYWLCLHSHKGPCLSVSESDGLSFPWVTPAAVCRAYLGCTSSGKAVIGPWQRERAG